MLNSGKGYLSHAIFNQKTLWIDQNGNEIMLSAMNKYRLNNLLKYLDKNADRFFLKELDIQIEGLQKLDESIIIGESISQEFIGYTTWDLTPKEWLSSTPLYREVLRLLNNTKKL